MAKIGNSLFEAVTFLRAPSHDAVTWEASLRAPRLQMYFFGKWEIPSCDGGWWMVDGGQSDKAHTLHFEEKHSHNYHILTITPRLFWPVTE